MSKVKEVLVGLVQGKGDKGEMVLRQIMFAGPVPFIAPGIYTEDNPPEGWRWPDFLKKAKKHDGHGVAVIYEGKEKPAMRAVVEKYMAEAKEQNRKQAEVRAAMVNGEHPEKPKTPEESKKPGGDK